jgi:3-oxoacyl-[acyl-carrier-protein] synthase II
MSPVVIVGVGVASARLGKPRDLLWQSAIEPASDPVATLGRGVRFKDRATKLAMVATERALADASLLDAGSASLAVPGDRFAVVGSSNLGNLDTVCRTAEAIASGSVTATSPMALPNASSNVVASSTAVRFRLRGPNLMVCNGSSSGLDAIRLGALLILSGRADRAVVVGVEPVNDVVTALTGRPEEELFDGAVAVVLESEAVARQRAATLLAWVGGYARRADAAASIACATNGSARPQLWLADATTEAPALVGDVPWKDLEAQLGHASGALGVLQVAAGAQWLAGGEAGPVLATAGSTDDGVSSLVLAKPRAAS